MAKIAEKGPTTAAAPDNAALIKALQERRDTLQKSSADLRDVAGRIPRELNEAERKVLAENAASISAAEADIAALEAPPKEELDDQIKALQKRRVELSEQQRVLANSDATRRLTDDERRRQQSNVTLLAELDHQIDQIERQKVRNLPPTERSKVLQKQRDALAQADADARTHLNAPAIADLDKQIENAKAEAAAEGEKK